ncbi:MAG: TonB-dependent receptor [Flavobacteriales bacterium]
MILSLLLKAKPWLCFLFFGLFSVAIVQAQTDQQKDTLSTSDTLQSIISSSEPEDVLTRLISPVLVLRDYMQNPLGSKVFPLSELGAQEIQSTNQFSLQDALNQIPGVKMDSRGFNGSRRLNLRGTLARSPFGVRNLRMTINGFPITSSDGSSALELLEPADINQIRIFKGPTGSYTMPGTGGLMAVQLMTRSNGRYEVQAGAGEFGGELGMSRAYASVGFGNQRLKTTISGIHSQNQGYRTHEANRKTQLTVNSKYRLNDKLNYQLLAMLYDGYWELPGHITLEQVKEDPTQSNDYSKEHDASVKRRRAYIGLGQNWRFTERFRNETRVFSHFTDKLNPYGNNPFFQGLKDEAAQEFGGRSEFILNSGKENFYKWTLKFGGQVQYFRTEIQEYVNDLGDNGELKYDNDTFITEGLVFGAAEWRPTDKLDISAQLGYNLYNITNTGINNEGDDLAFKVNTREKFLPRLGLSYSLINDHTSLSLSYAHGMAYPGIFEWVDTQTGLFSEELQPEESVNYEFQVATKTLRSRLDLSASVYYSELTNTITELDTDNGVLYENSGESLQRGIEFQASFNQQYKSLKYSIYGTATLTDYEFVNDTSELKLRIPGIVPVTLASGIKVSAQKWQADVHARFISDIPTAAGDELNDDTDYLLLNAKVNYELLKKGRVRLEVHVGVNNLLNSSYTSFFRISTRPEIFNPMPSRNYYAGLTLKRS